jgi:hypothetical protein
MLCMPFPKNITHRTLVSYCGLDHRQLLHRAPPLPSTEFVAIIVTPPIPIRFVRDHAIIASEMQDQNPRMAELKLLLHGAIVRISLKQGEMGLFIKECVGAMWYVVSGTLTSALNDDPSRWLCYLKALDMRPVCHIPSHWNINVKSLTTCSLGRRRVFRCPDERLHMGPETIHKF